MGILMGALGGAGAAMEGYFDNRQKADLSRENTIATDNNRSDLKIKEEQAMVLFKQTQGDLQREQKAGRLNSATDGILGGMASKNAIDAYGPDGAGLTANDLLPEEKAAFAPPPEDRLKAMQQAALQSGDMDTFKMLHDANSKDELNDTKNYFGAKNLEMRGALNDSRAAMAQQTQSYRTAMLEARQAGRDGDDAKQLAAQARMYKVNDQQIHQMFGGEIELLIKAVNDPLSPMTPEQKTQAGKRVALLQTKQAATMALSRSNEMDAANAAGYVDDIMAGKAEVRQSGGKYYVSIDGEPVQVPMQLKGFINSRQSSDTPSQSNAPTSKAAPASGGILSNIAASVSKPKAVMDPVESQFNTETREMNDMKRTAYSTDVQDWLDKRNAGKRAQDESQSAADRADELKRAQARSRAINGH